MNIKLFAFPLLLSQCILFLSSCSNKVSHELYVEEVECLEFSQSYNQNSTRKDIMPAAFAIDIAKKEYASVSKLPKDYIIVIEIEGNNYIITFKPKVVIQPGGTYHAKFIIDAKKGSVIQRIAADA